MNALRHLALALFLALACLAVLAGRAVLDGEREMAASNTAFNQGSLAKSTLHARRAAVLYVPGAPHVSAAYARLEALARGAEAAGKYDAALAAWRAMRGAALETRHVTVAAHRELALANKNLARLTARAPTAQADGPAATVVDDRQVVERAQAELARDDAPRPVWLVVVVLGFALGLLGLSLFALRGVQKDGRILLGSAKLGVALSVLGIVCSVVAVWKA